MNRDQVLAALRRHRQDIEQRFAIKQQFPLIAS